jgi:hypothetical protein
MITAIDMANSGFIYLVLVISEFYHILLSKIRANTVERALQLHCQSWQKESGEKNHSGVLLTDRPNRNISHDLIENNDAIWIPIESIDVFIKKFNGIK